MNNEQPLVFAHIGDLHITKAKEQNYIDFMSIVSQLEVQCSRQLDFVVLPGDNADNGLPEQYKLVETALKMLSTPVHIIPGDHDMEQKSLDNYNQVSFTEKLPLSLPVKGKRCLFLDASVNGKGGPDFRFGKKQLQWLEDELSQSSAAKEDIIIFTHTFPTDLADKAETAALNKLIDENNVALVDMGHTHYNELANDGDTIFAATRSTGQIEEGPVGYSLTTLYNGVVSWRFKPLHDAFPFVMITSPADYRLMRNANQKLEKSAEVSALIFGSQAIRKVACRVEDGDWTPMARSSDDNTWTLAVELPKQKLVMIEVEAVDETGRPGRHAIKTATESYKSPIRKKTGSDENSVGSWPENGIFGTQLGPNSNTKPS